MLTDWTLFYLKHSFHIQQHVTVHLFCLLLGLDFMSTAAGATVELNSIRWWRLTFFFFFSLLLWASVFCYSWFPHDSFSILLSSVLFHDIVSLFGPLWAAHTLHATHFTVWTVVHLNVHHVRSKWLSWFSCSYKRVTASLFVSETVWPSIVSHV